MRVVAFNSEPPIATVEYVRGRMWPARARLRFCDFVPV